MSVEEMPIFNVIASYKDSDGGVYEWEGHAADYDDAIRKAQLQAWEDNCPTAAAEGEAPTDMLDEVKGFSVVDVTGRHALKAEVAAALRAEADVLDRTRHPHITDAASERADYLRELAQRVETFPVHA
jgi:hypothetical protein